MASRVLVVWCPDWAVVAAAAVGGVSAGVPMAVVAANRVVATSAMARREGVRRGMRRREAQGRCPELMVFADDSARDARLFEPVAAAVEELAVGVEVVRPGVVAVPARGPVNYFGGAEQAAERLVDRVALRTNVECQVGIADGLFAATLAAHRGWLIAPDRTPEFLASLGIHELNKPELVDLLRRLGLKTLGAFAEISERDVASRFGADAVKAHRLARGLEERPPSRRQPPPDLTVTENVIVGALARTADMKQARDAALEALAFVDLLEKRNHFARELSTGQRKRLELARGLAMKPRIVLMDEVTGGVDQSTIPGLVDLVLELKRQGVTIVTIEHNMQVMMRISDRILALYAGRRIAFGKPEEVRQDPAVVDAYLGTTTHAA